MDDPHALSTSPTLLGQLRLNPPDSGAWETFVHRYGPRIFAWCVQRNLQESDAQDVTQDVLAKLVTRMRTFVYDETKSFRAWLKTVTVHALCDFVEEQRRAGQGSGDSAIVSAMEKIEAREGLLQQLDKEFDLELLEEAAARVRQRVKPHTWEVFRLLTEERITVEEVAHRLEMEFATVVVTRSKVKKMLREEINKLEHGD